ncbi:MAG TPA: serine/threonine-protein kinase [Polyangiaceae bacterium]|jgi:serine/threonine-protein kinase|nr:serine/threonine-protein kinase [Polyangiaceae bacterium]
MNGRGFPTGQANIGLLKALYRTLSTEQSAAAADAWLRSIRMMRADFADETRTLPLAAVHRALVAFADAASRDAIPRAWKFLVAPDSLGVWVRVLRGTTEPAEAFARLEAADSQYGRTTRWETTDTRRGWWRGKVTVAHDPALETDGLMRLARLAELAAIPALFGYPGATSRLVSGVASGGDTAGIVQEYEVSWAVPDGTSSGAIGGALGLVIGAVPLMAHVGTVGLCACIAAAVGAAGAVGGLARARELLRRAESHAQKTRVHALERSLSLKEAHDGGIGANLEGSVAAGQYRISRRMGAGATGVIYEAVRISDGLPVAIKLLRVAAAHDAVASDRLRREAEALGLAWHPNVVEVIDHGHLPDGTAYLVMELLPGESLATRLRNRGRLTPRELLPIALQMCDALAAVHAAGVVHRDVKPSNILLAVDRDDPAGPERVKLLDFGIARVEWEETRITNTGGPLGTPGYMSPEQETGEGEIDGRSDLFGLGAVLFECLVGEPPPPRSPSGLIRTSDGGSRLDSGTQKAAAFVPPKWRAAIEKAMAPKPSDRYQDARAFAQDLRAVREDLVEASS